MQPHRDSFYRESPMAPSVNKEWTPRNYYKPSGSKGYLPPDHLDQGSSNQHYSAGSSTYGAGGPRYEASMDASRTTTSSRDEPSVSVSNASEVETEWVEEDEPGVYITIRQLADGTRELRRVRFRYFKFTFIYTPHHLLAKMKILIYLFLFCTAEKDLER